MEKSPKTFEELQALDLTLRAESLSCYPNKIHYFDYGTAGYRSLGKAIKYVITYLTTSNSLGWISCWICGWVFEQVLLS